MKNYFKILIILLSLFIPGSCSRTHVLYLAGDSTMAHKRVDRRPETGWGEALADCFNDKIIIDNRAANGRSTRSFIYEGKWDSIVSALKKGDFVVIQFGHNDGVVHKTGRYCMPEEYRYNLTKFIRETKGKGAKPILCTPIQRRKFDSVGNLKDTHGVYPGIVREIAVEYNVTLIDMQLKSDSLISAFGVEASKKLFMNLEPGKYANYPEGKIDNTHFVPIGAKKMAELFIEGIIEQNLELSEFLNDTCYEIQ